MSSPSSPVNTFADSDDPAAAAASGAAAYAEESFIDSFQTARAHDVRLCDRIIISFQRHGRL